MKELQSANSGWKANNVRNTLRLAYWTAAWLVATALAAFGPKMLWGFNTLLTLIAILASLGVGAGMILATIRHLKGLDELHQKIFLEASALALGVALVCGSSYELMEDVKLISFQPEISHLIILIGLTFLTAIAVGNWRYR